MLQRKIRPGRWAGHLATLTLAAGLTGCAGPGFWDDVTSRDFHFKNMFSSSPPPMTVLRESSDGDARAKAMLALKEPRANGGSDSEQEEAIQLLTRIAISDPQPLCRRAAIQALGRFHDPRSVPALTQAYETAAQLPTEVAGPLQTQTLAALGETKQPAAVTFLVQMAIKPMPAEMTDRERQGVRDNRLAAVRALGNFEGSPEAAAAAGRLAESERDVALRDRARESYAKVTGKEPPAFGGGGTQPPLPQTPANDMQLTGARQPQ
ncbi:MAG TPA: HEAT repeat domain-containing protein [Gemmataceae bacterium]|nr:HEAT repeat domain-containing protein [Gemmataceae bacterium]